MKINKITIENFKFHRKLEFDIKTKNCLIYGENGTGKSSIYEALYSNFYYFKDEKITSVQPKIRDKFLHRDYTSDDLIVNVLFDDEQKLYRTDEVLENSDILEQFTVYFANEKRLSNILDGNLYDIINNYLTTHFKDLKILNSIYYDLKKDLEVLPQNIEIKDTKLIEKRIKLDKDYHDSFKKLIPSKEINHILKNDLKCNFEIKFLFKDSSIDNDTHNFTNPIISIKIKDIDDRGDFESHFNEAKLKLISIAIYFGLAKKYETDSSSKLLVLDDFLTSLDMANRKLITRYILDNFKKYQIIILTHNLQFNNVIKKLFNDEEWDTKILFTINEDDNIRTIIKDKNDNFIEEAKKFINTKNYDLQIAGNLLRKAFESIIFEFEQRLELGKSEKLQNIIDVLKNDNKVFYDDPHKTIGELISYLKKILGNEIIADKKDMVKKKLDVFNNNKIAFKDGTYNFIKKAEFYKNILLNPVSHHDSEAEIYKSECENTIVLLEGLNNMLEDLKKY